MQGLGAAQPPLVGRERWIRELRASLAVTAEGRGGCLIVEGPAGIGKTRLLAEAAHAAQEHQLPVGMGRATEVDHIMPLGALVRALRTGGDPVLDAASVAWLGEQSLSRFWVLDRLGDLLDEAVARSPRLVVLDDAHWLDELSALALRTLVPATRNTPVLWLLSRRSNMPRSAATDALDHLVAEGAVRLPLEPLDRADVARVCEVMLGAAPDRDLLDLAERSGGNPFLLQQLLVTMSEEGSLELGSGRAQMSRSGPLPPAFRDAVEYRLRDLGPDARRLLQVGAVLGRPFSVHELAALLDLPALQLLPLIAEAERAGLLVAAGDELAFAHDVIREAVYDDLSAPVRQALHREAVAVLENEGRPVLETAEHLLRGARRGDRRAVDVLMRAAETISPRAPSTAADLLLRAVGLFADDDPDRPGAIAAALRQLADAGRLLEAQNLGTEALKQVLDPASEGAILLGLSEAYKHAGKDDAVIEVTHRALALQGVPTATRAHLLGIRAHGLLFIGDPDEADEAGQQAAELGEAAGEPGAVVFGLVARSTIAWFRGHLQAALELAQQAADRVQGDPDARRRHPELWLGSALLSLDRFAEAEDTLDRGQREADRLGTAWSLPLWHYFRAELRLAEGRLGEAANQAQIGLEVSRQLAAEALVVRLLAVRVETALRTDKVDGARRYLQRAQDSVEPGASLPPELMWARALLHRSQGETAEALAVLRPVFETLQARQQLLMRNPSIAAQLVRIAVVAKDRAAAETAAAAARSLAALNPEVGSVQAAARHASGLLERSRPDLHAAVELYRQAPRPLALAGALDDAARLEQAAGQRSAAVTLLREAAERYAACGSTSDEARVTQRLRGLGALPSGASAGAPKAGWESLTEGELRVVRLVAKGLTNRKVASELFLSPHTVDTHLRHAFLKLDVSSRVEMTRYVMLHDRE